MSLRDKFLKKKDAEAQAETTDPYRRAAEEIGKKLDAFVPRIHDALEEYFMRLDARRAAGWLLRRRMQSSFNLQNVDAEAFTPAALDTLPAYDILKDICSCREIDTAIDCRFIQEGKNVCVSFQLAPNKRYAESTFEIATASGTRRRFDIETAREILPEGGKPPETPAPQAAPPVETDSSITVKKPLTLKNKTLFS